MKITYNTEPFEIKDLGDFIQWFAKTIQYPELQKQIKGEESNVYWIVKLNKDVFLTSNFQRVYWFIASEFKYRESEVTEIQIKTYIKN
jgi:hypothetical protein